MVQNDRIENTSGSACVASNDNRLRINITEIKAQMILNYLGFSILQIKRTDNSHLSFMVGVEGLEPPTLSL